MGNIPPYASRYAATAEYRTSVYETFLSYADYSWVIVLTGQPAAQLPQSMHLSASITYLSSPMLIAPTGQVLSHAPQEMQSSPIQYAIVLTSITLR